MSIKYDVVWGEGSYAWHPDLVNMYGCIIGDDTHIGAFCEIRDGVTIGSGCRLQASVFIPEGVHIGNNVFIGPNVCFTNDKYPRVKSTWERLDTVVEDGVSIGANATICPGVKIGANAMVGAGAVVTKDVSPGSIVVGSPARNI